VVAAKLLEGRIAVFVDGTPVVLTLPYLFIENFQSNEDYYLSFYYTTFTRALRILGFFLTILVPAIYIAIVAYHQEMLPAPLLISIATERQGVPLPAALEAMIMLVVFEIFRETALRMQTNVGQALSIVGALEVGQAAVEAKLIAAPIIIVAMSGITSLLVPKMNAPILLLRFGILLLASCLGFLGVTVGFAFLLAHVLGLQGKSAYKIYLPGVLMRVGLFALIILRNFFILGPDLEAAAKFSTYMAVRIIEVGSFFERIESSISFVYILLGVTKMTLFCPGRPWGSPGCFGWTTTKSFWFRPAFLRWPSAR
jgi:hypothetical protein